MEEGYFFLTDPDHARSNLHRLSNCECPDAHISDGEGQKDVGGLGLQMKVMLCSNCNGLYTVSRSFYDINTLHSQAPYEMPSC